MSRYNPDLEICRVCYSADVDVVASSSYAVKCMECFTKVQCYNSKEEAISVWNSLMQRAGSANLPHPQQNAPDHEKGFDIVHNDGIVTGVN